MLKRLSHLVFPLNIIVRRSSNSLKTCLRVSYNDIVHWLITRSSNEALPEDFSRISSKSCSKILENYKLKKSGGFGKKYFLRFESDGSIQKVLKYEANLIYSRQYFEAKESPEDTLWVAKLESQDPNLMKFCDKVIVKRNLSKRITQQSKEDGRVKHIRDIIELFQAPADEVKKSKLEICPSNTDVLLKFPDFRRFRTFYHFHDSKSGKITNETNWDIKIRQDFFRTDSDISKRLVTYSLESKLPAFEKASQKCLTQMYEFSSEENGAPDLSKGCVRTVSNINDVDVLTNFVRGVSSQSKVTFSSKANSYVMTNQKGYAKPLARLDKVEYINVHDQNCRAMLFVIYTEAPQLELLHKMALCQLYCQNEQIIVHVNKILQAMKNGSLYGNQAIKDYDDVEPIISKIPKKALKVSQSRYHKITDDRFKLIQDIVNKDGGESSDYSVDLKCEKYAFRDPKDKASEHHVFHVIHTTDKSIKKFEGKVFIQTLHDSQKIITKVDEIMKYIKSYDKL